MKSVVVLWGAAQHNIPDGAQVDGIGFVSGRRLVGWLARLEGQHVTKDAAGDLLGRLTEFRAAAWDSAKDAVR